MPLTPLGLLLPFSVLFSEKVIISWASPYSQDLLDHRGFLDDREEPHLPTAVRADERAYFVDFLDQARPGTSEKAV